MSSSSESSIIEDLVARDALRAALFYKELIKLKLSEDLAKDLTIAYVAGMQNVIQ